MSYDPNLAKSIFLQAMELPSGPARTTFVAQACAGQPDLQARIECLLKTAANPDSLLDQPLSENGKTRIVAGQTAQLTLDFLQPCAVPGSLGRLGSYTILDVIGRGGMGIVMRAMDSKLNRIVAIKSLAPEFAGNPQARKRFLREAQAAAAISHDHVVTIHAVDDDESVPFIVMECIVGMSLQEKIDKVGALELKEILRIGMQIASGLAAAHKQGLVHRDIKPANILLENGIERVKITDFGLARATDDVGMTQSGQITGTPQYMSPEQAMGQTVDQRSDLFSLGSVLYTLCTGRPAFRADSVIAVLRRVCDDAPRPIGETNPEVPDWLIEIIDKLLSKQPGDRIQTAIEVADLLNAHLAHLQQPTWAPRPGRLSRSSSSRSKAWKGIWLLASSLVVCGLAIFGVKVLRDRVEGPGIQQQTTSTTDDSSSQNPAPTAVTIDLNGPWQTSLPGTMEIKHAPITPGFLFMQVEGETVAGGEFRGFIRLEGVLTVATRTIEGTLAARTNNGNSIYGIAMARIRLVLTEDGNRIEGTYGWRHTATGDEPVTAHRYTMRRRSATDSESPTLASTVPQFPFTLDGLPGASNQKSEKPALVEKIPSIDLLHSAALFQLSEKLKGVHYEAGSLHMSAPGDGQTVQVWVDSVKLYRGRMRAVVQSVGNQRQGVIGLGWDHGGGSPRRLDAILSTPDAGKPIASLWQYGEDFKVKGLVDRRVEVDWSQPILIETEIEDGTVTAKVAGVKVAIEKGLDPTRPVFPFLAGVNCQWKVLEWELQTLNPRPKPESNELNNEKESTVPDLANAPFDTAQASRHQKAWAKHLGVPVERTDSLGIRLRLIPPGKFQMGSTAEELARLKQELQDADASAFDTFVAMSSGPRHPVELSQPFYAGKHEVTVSQFQQFLDATGYVVSAERAGNPRFTWKTFIPPSANATELARQPACGVSWEDAKAFCKWLNDRPENQNDKLIYDLPTEAQWEYACRAGAQTLWSFGDNIDNLSEHAVFGLKGTPYPPAVGLRRANAFGLFDMHGNVDEWCLDWHNHGFYARSPLTDPLFDDQPNDGASGRVSRGGAWNADAWWSRSTTRTYDFPVSPAFSKGFRVFAKPVLP